MANENLVKTVESETRTNMINWISGCQFMAIYAVDEWQRENFYWNCYRWQCHGQTQEQTTSEHIDMQLFVEWNTPVEKESSVL